VRQEGGLLDVFGPHFAQDIACRETQSWFDENMYPLWYPDSRSAKATTKYYHLPFGIPQIAGARWEQQLVCSQMLLVAHADVTHLCRANIFGHTTLHLVRERRYHISWSTWFMMTQ
jgi:hypothetical protein